MFSPEDSDIGDGDRLDEVSKNAPGSKVEEYPLTDKTYEQDHGLASGMKSSTKADYPNVIYDQFSSSQKAAARRAMIVVEEEETPTPIVGAGEERLHVIKVNSSEVQSRQ